VLALVQGWRAATVLFEGADAVRFLVGGLLVPVLLVSTIGSTPKERGGSPSACGWPSRRSWRASRSRQAA